MIRDYLIESAPKRRLRRIQYNILQPLPSDIDFARVITDIEDTIPAHLYEQVDAIYIGEFDELKEKDKKAAYMDGAIFVDNEHLSEQDLIENIVHEIAHAVEATYGNYIYSDGRVEREFLGKRKRLYDLLLHGQGHHEGAYISQYEEQFKNSDYSEKLDSLLYNKIGYETIASISMGLFISAYSPTSLAEYFAVGFEFYYLDTDWPWLKGTCPILYEKIKGLEELPNNES